ncbi:MAG TPA: hypothetical protein VMC62_11420, partial [Longilinea sp.]|nr:hypothetical protein [Longilinea sp.]
IKFIVRGSVILLVTVVICAGCTFDKTALSFLAGATATPTPTETPLPTSTSTPTPLPTATETPLPEPTGDLSQPFPSDGLGITRQELIAFFNSGNAFTFEKPSTYKGEEFVTGYHQWICVKGDCAALTIFGPSDNVDAVSLAVPMNPNDKTESMTALTLLMNMAGFFDNSGPAYPSQLANDIWLSWEDDTDFDQSYNIDGLVFAEKYDSSAHIAMLLIVRYSAVNSINT